MKLATLRNGKPDGTLVVVSRDLTRCTSAQAIAPTLQAALDDWAAHAPKLRKLADDLEAGRIAGEAFDQRGAMAPLPRAYQFIDGSFYLPHTELMSRWRNMPVPKIFFEEPMAYQGCSSPLLGPTDDMLLAGDDWGLDFEAEVALILDTVPLGTKAPDTSSRVALVMLCNDVSLRGLIPREISKEFGFVQSKPPSAFSPVAVTPDELGSAWDGNLLHRPAVSTYNGKIFGQPNAGRDATFGFQALIAHLARTRTLGPGTIVGSGTISNHDRATGSSCLAERRAIETIDSGAPITPWMSVGDRYEFEMFDDEKRSIFGKIDQNVVGPA